MAIQGIDHLSLYVEDIEEALTFYRRLGFEVLWEEEWRRFERLYPVLQIGPQQAIHLLIKKDFASLINVDKAQPGGAHICLLWDGPAHELGQFLQERGIKPELGPTGRAGAQGQGTSYYIRDPEGNLIEFLTYDQPEVKITPLE